MTLNNDRTQAKTIDSQGKSAGVVPRIGYWVTTGILVFCMTGGIFELIGARTTLEGIMKLGYPAYIIPVLGLGKVLAILAILWPGLPRLKEWAYAGVFFNMVGATASHIANNVALWHVIVTVTIAAITLASWALRPQSRRLGNPMRRHEGGGRDEQREPGAVRASLESALASNKVPLS